MQVVVAVACAEEAHEFEHRDLHAGVVVLAAFKYVHPFTGNVLIRQVKEKCVDCRLGQRDRSMQTNSVRATIIDFSNSRIRLGDRILLA